MPAIFSRSLDGHVRQAAVGEEARDRRDRHDRAGGVRGDHGVGALAQAHDSAAEVDGLDAVPLVEVEAADPRHAPRAGGQHRLVDAAGGGVRERVKGSLPAVITCDKGLNKAPAPSLPNIMAAKKAPLETLSLSDLGVSSGEVGLGSAWSAVEDFAARPPKAAGVVVTDEGDGAQKIEEFLVTAKLV